MHIKTLAIHGSPYIGIFCAVTDEIALVAGYLNKKDQKKVEDTLNVEAIPTTIADSHLVGALVKGMGKKFATAHTLTDEEKDFLQSNGINVHAMHGITAIGNLLCLQKNGGIVSPLIHETEIKALEAFFDVKLHAKHVAGSELAGSCLISTEKGFLAHPKTEPTEMEWLEKLFKVPGMTTTANYGDPFIANSIIANAYGALVGERTSGPELARIDEGLHPGLTFE
jgi:translation initiation factor 6